MTVILPTKNQMKFAESELDQIETALRLYASLKREEAFEESPRARNGLMKLVDSAEFLANRIEVRKRIRS